MNTSLKIGALVLCLALAGCGGDSSTTSTLPTPNTNTNPGGTLNNQPQTDSRLPDLTGAVPINLTDKVSFTAINDLLSPSNQFVALPLVLEPVIKMTLANDRSTNVKGKVLIAFEDKIGFWGAELSTVDGASIRNSSNIDTIHTDTEFTLRVLASISGADMYGIVYYRIRKTTPMMETQCLQQTVRCVDAYGRELPASFCSYPTPNIVDTCRNYMNPSDSNVKTLGTFQAKVANWFTN